MLLVKRNSAFEEGGGLGTNTILFFLAQRQFSFFSYFVFPGSPYRIFFSTKIKPSSNIGITSLSKQLSRLFEIER